MRLLAVVRLSALTDETTSPERQQTKITTYARLHDHEVVGLAGDLDVSGSVSRFDSPQLGAARSRRGQSAIAWPSAAAGGTVSRVVPTLNPGAGAVASRGDVHFVVTEYGMADLYARGVHERARIQLAHPGFQAWLEQEAGRLLLTKRTAR